MQKNFQHFFMTRIKQNQPLISFTDYYVWNWNIYLIIQNLAGELKTSGLYGSSVTFDLKTAFTLMMPSIYLVARGVFNNEVRE